MNTKRTDTAAEIAALIASMDFSDDPAPAKSTQTRPRPVYLQPPKSGVATVYSADDESWIPLGEGVWDRRATAEAAINYALSPPREPQWDYGGHVGDAWQWYGADVFYRNVGATHLRVKKTAGGWLCEARQHLAQGYFKTSEEAIDAANKLIT